MLYYKIIHSKVFNINEVKLKKENKIKIVYMPNCVLKKNTKARKEKINKNR